MRDITLCHPRLQDLATKLVEECSNQGLKIKIGETLRTVAEQDNLYAQGRTKPGKIVTNASGSTYSSYHQWGTAFDIIRNDGKGAYNESGDFFHKVGMIGVSLGLEWGGNWKDIKDKPHFQLPDWGSSTSGIKKLYKNPDEFKNTWVEVKSGWRSEEGGCRFYLGNTERYICNDWHQEPDGSWYWFNGAGFLETNTWYQYKGSWYYLGADGAMVKGLQAIDGKWYYLDRDGKLSMEPLTLTPDMDGALQNPKMVL